MLKADKYTFLVVFQTAALLFAHSGIAQETEDFEVPVSVLDLVEECDILAAHPLDSSRMSEGVDDENIVPGLANPACEDALTRLPDEPRLVFQMGRAKLASGDESGALDQFQKAAELGHGAALAYLGDSYQFGLSVDVDAEQALNHYQQAIEAGFPAGPQIEMMQFDAGMYSVPIVRVIYEGSLDVSVSSGDLRAHLTRNYVFSFISFINDECGAILASQTMSKLFSYRYPNSNYDPEIDGNIRVAVMGSTAEYDARRFLQRHGCDGFVGTSMIESINKVFS